MVSGVRGQCCGTVRGTTNKLYSSGSGYFRTLQRNLGNCCNNKNKNDNHTAKGNKDTTHTWRTLLLRGFGRGYSCQSFLTFVFWVSPPDRRGRIKSWVKFLLWLFKKKKLNSCLFVFTLIGVPPRFLIPSKHSLRDVGNYSAAQRSELTLG